MSTVKEKCIECIKGAVKGAPMAYYLKLLEGNESDRDWANVFQVPDNSQEPCPWCRQSKEIKCSLLTAKL